MNYSDSFAQNRNRDLRKSFHCPGNFGGNTHRGIRCHSMQSFGGPIDSIIVT